MNAVKLFFGRRRCRAFSGAVHAQSATAFLVTANFDQFVWLFTIEIGHHELMDLARVLRAPNRFEPFFVVKDNPGRSSAVSGNGATP